MKRLIFGVLILGLLSSTANAGPEPNHTGHWVAQGQWQMNDIGRSHGVITEPGMPKCNPWVSPECARPYPSLFKKVRRP